MAGLSESARKMFDNAWNETAYIDNSNDKSKTSAIVSALEGLALTIAESTSPKQAPMVTFASMGNMPSTVIDPTYDFGTGGER